MVGQLSPTLLITYIFIFFSFLNTHTSIHYMYIYVYFFLIIHLMQFCHFFPSTSILKLPTFFSSLLLSYLFVAFHSFFRYLRLLSAYMYICLPRCYCYYFFFLFVCCSIYMYFAFITHFYMFN